MQIASAEILKERKYGVARSGRVKMRPPPPPSARRLN
jgi:hypothetical protein